MTSTYSEALRNLVIDEKHKDAIQELFISQSEYINACRDRREEMAAKEGIPYKDFIEKIQTEILQLLNSKKKEKE